MPSAAGSCECSWRASWWATPRLRIETHARRRRTSGVRLLGPTAAHLAPCSRWLRTGATFSAPLPRGCAETGRARITCERHEKGSTGSRPSDSRLFPRPPAWPGAKRSSGLLLELGDDGVACEGASRAGGFAQGFDQLIVVGLAECLTPRFRRLTSRPSGRVDKTTSIHACAVRLGARPRVPLGMADDPCSHGSSLDVPHRGVAVGLVKWAGEESALPEMAAAAMESVDGLGVLPVRPPDRALEAIGGRRNEHQLHLVAHEAPRDHSDAVFRDLLREEVQVQLAILIGEEDVLAVIAALGHEVGEAGNDDAGGSSHGWMIEEAEGGTRRQRLRTQERSPNSIPT